MKGQLSVGTIGFLAAFWLFFAVLFFFVLEFLNVFGIFTKLAKRTKFRLRG